MQEKKSKATVPQEYGDQSIRALKGAERVRQKPSVMFGSNALDGCEHSFFEILANSADEARAGYGDKIIVTTYLDWTIQVEDFGRGVPLGWNEHEQRYNWELVYCELFAGGKYDTNQEGSAYKFSLGLNGLGACATQYCSEFMYVGSYKNGMLSEMDFKEGDPVGKLRVTELPKDAKKNTGTITRWRPDPHVFTDTHIPEDFYRDTLRRQAVINAKVHFIWNQETEPGVFEETDFYYEDGIAEYARQMTSVDSFGNPICWHMNELRGQDAADRDVYTVMADIAFCPMKRNGHTEYYHNTSYLEYGGSPDKAVKAAFTFAVDKYLKAQNKYYKNESKISFQDISDSLFLVISSASTETSYENQTKKAINNSFIQKALTEFLKEKLEYFFIENPDVGAQFAQACLINKRAREKAESTIIDVRKKLSTGVTESALTRIDKFVTCQSKDPSVRELYIVEGDSALTSCKLGRNADFQAIIPVRGKTINCMKASYENIFKNETALNLLKIFGCGVEIDKKRIKGDMAPFNFKNLKWSKIILCTDADVDGFQIRTLLLTLFYRLLPTLLQEEKVFIAETPLFEITSGGETYFAYNESEKTQIIEQLGSKKYTLQRSKGLGENEPDMMWKTTMNPATRRLIAVTPTDVQETLRMFEVLLGEGVEDRRQFIIENGERYRADADIN